MTEERSSVAEGLAGMLNVFIDPAAVAKRVTAPWFWVWPLLVLVVVYGVFGYLMTPWALQVADISLRERGNIPPDQMERARSMAHMITQVIVIATPVFVIGFIALTSALVSAVCSMLDIQRRRFRDIFSLVAVSSLIPMLQYIATYIVLRSRGEIQSREEMTPPFGLDIFMQGSHGVFYAILNFFSIFQIWQIVILGFAFSYFAGVSKTKAFLAITPVWLIPLLLRVVGALFTPSGQ
jgi:hypothetical protein